MFCQSFELRGRQTHFLLVAFGRSRRFVPLLILAISHIPVVQVHLIEKRFLLVFRQQTTFERIVEFFFVSYVNIIQCHRQIEHLTRPHINANFPQNSPKLGQTIEQSLTTLNF